MPFVSVELDKLKGCYNGDDAEVLSDELVAWMYVLADGYAAEGGDEGCHGQVHHD